MMLSSALLDEAFERQEEAVLLLDDGLRIVRANAAFRHWSGYARDELARQPLEMLSAGWHAPSDYEAIRESLAEHGEWHGEIWQRRHNGEFHPDHVIFKRLAAPGIEAGYVLCCFTDATKRCEQEEKLQRMAMYDELTDLPNRRLLQIHLEQAMLRCQRHQRLVAVCMLDLDGFKPVNDRYGHEAGDQVLVVLGKRLPSALRKSDLVARIGGDEFVLLIEEINGLADLEPLLNKVHGVISAPIRLANGALIQVGTSVGVVLYPTDAAVTGDLLLRHADQALYASKNHKHDRARFWSLFGEEQVPRIDRRAEGLIAAERVEVHYQPILSNKHNRIVGIEALARLRDESGQLLLPDAFIDHLKPESLTLLSRAVLRQALQDLAALDARCPGLWLSFNVDPSSLGKDCLPCLRGVIEESSIDPSRITLEILESNDFIERERDAALSVLHQIKAIGIRLALDDVGSAYASLMRLKELPIDEIKLDQGFIRSLEARPHDLHFVRAIQDLAIELKVDLVVEGVETPDILDAMLTTGVPYLQGYAIARPMPVDALEAFLAGYQPAAGPFPSGLFGYYAGTMASHTSLKKMFMINPAEIDLARLGDSRLCRGHAVQQRLGCGDEAHTLASLHERYHRAIAEAARCAGDNFRNTLWDDVEASLEEFLRAMLDEWRLRHRNTATM